MSVSVAAYRKALKERTRERVSQPAANALMTLAMFARSRQRYRGPSDSPNRLDVAEEHRILFCARLVHTFQGGWARELNSEPLCATQVPRPTKTSFVFFVPRLQHRGVFRKEYRGKTLRDHRQLPIPKIGA